MRWKRFVRLMVELLVQQRHGDSAAKCWLCATRFREALPFEAPSGVDEM